VTTGCTPRPDDLQLDLIADGEVGATGRDVDQLPVGVVDAVRNLPGNAGLRARVVVDVEDAASGDVRELNEVVRLLLRRVGGVLQHGGDDEPDVHVAVARVDVSRRDGHRLRE
jgi:hypothetical protein